MLHLTMLQISCIGGQRYQACQLKTKFWLQGMNVTMGGVMIVKSGSQGIQVIRILFIDCYA